MKKFFGYLILGVTLFLNWIVQIGLGLYAIYYIVMTFIDNGVLWGLLSIPIAGICLWFAHLIVALILAPLGISANMLLERNR